MPVFKKTPLCAAKKQKSPQEKQFLRREITPRYHSICEKIATLGSSKPLPLTRETENPDSYCSNSRLGSDGYVTVSYRLTPTADSLKALLPDRLRHRLYAIILAQLRQKVKYFFVVKIAKSEKAANPLFE